MNIPNEVMVLVKRETPVILSHFPDKDAAWVEREFARAYGNVEWTEIDNPPAAYLIYELIEQTFEIIL